MGAALVALGGATPLCTAYPPRGTHGTVMSHLLKLF